MTRILAADIGGTSSRFASFSADNRGPLRHEGSEWIKTGDVGSFDDLMARLRESPFPLDPGDADGAVIAVAGPVEGGTRSAPPNISWKIDLAQSAARAGLGKAALINDFIAQAFATLSPIAAAAEEILPGRAAEGGVVGVIGAGTGLGHAALAPTGGGAYVAVPSEKGHAAFSLSSPREQEFQEFLRRQTGETYPRGDTIVSGRGLSLIHLFLTGEDLSPEEVTPLLTPSSETLHWAARFYGRACRDYVLTVLARGGLYIAGGLAVRTPALVKSEAFAAEFRGSPTMAALLAEVPVHLISDEESGLWGAAQYALQVLLR